MSAIPLFKSATGKEMLRDYLLGSALVGGGTGLGVVLLNHLKSIKQRGDRAKDTSGDDDVLYVNMPPKVASTAAAPADKKDEGMDWGNAIGPSLAYASILPVGLGTHHLVRKYYQAWKKKQLQKELDQAQQIYLTSLGSTKAANVGDHVLGVAGALPLLLLLASGAGTYHTLNQKFPAPSANKTPRPRRLVVQDPAADLEAQEGMIKEQALQAELDESTLRTVLAMPGVAAESGLGDVAKCAAHGKTNELLTALGENVELMFAFAKEAAAALPQPSRFRSDMAIGWLVNDPEIGPTITKLAAAEFFEAAPSFISLGAAALESDDGEDLVKLAAVYNAAARAEYYAMDVRPAAPDRPKSAGFLPQVAMADVLRSTLESQADLPDNREDEDDPRVTVVTQASEDSTENKSDGDRKPQARPRVTTKSVRTRRWVEENKDVVDDILAPKKQEQPAGPAVSA